MDGWWVTRLTAIYLANDPEVLGPVRSARLVCIELANQYQGAAGALGRERPGALADLAGAVRQPGRVLPPHALLLCRRAGMDGAAAYVGAAHPRVHGGAGLRGAGAPARVPLRRERAQGPAGAEVTIPYPRQQRRHLALRSESGQLPALGSAACRTRTARPASNSRPATSSSSSSSTSRRISSRTPMAPHRSASS